MLVAGAWQNKTTKRVPRAQGRNDIEQAFQRRASNEKSHRPANTMKHQDLVKLWVVGDLVLPLGMMSDLWLVSGGLDLSG